MNSQLSKNINVLIVISTIAVVLVHTTEVSPKPENLLKDVTGSIDFYITFWLKNIISAIGVPVFFFISGYLYFIGETDFQMNTYLKKTKKRFNSLLLPYIIWILATIFIFELLLLISGKGIDYNLLDVKSFWNYSSVSAGLHGTETNYMPINSPLWYLRDLIILCLFSPIIYYIARTKYARYIVLTLLIWYISGKYPHPVVGLGSCGIAFFSIGAMLALRGVDFTIIPKSNQIIILGLFTFSICLTFVIDPTSFKGYIVSRISCILLILIFVSLSNKISYRRGTLKSLIKQHSFFIYASQGIITLWLVNLSFEWLFPTGLIMRGVLKSIICAVAVIMLSLCVSVLLNKYYPKSHNLICGGR